MHATKTCTVLVAALLAFGAGPATAAQGGQAAPDLTGTWIGSTLVPNVGDDAIKLDLKKEGDTYTGTCTDAAGIIVGPQIAAVAFKDGTLSFDIGVSTGADSSTVHISLKVDGDKMAGYWTTDQGESGELKLAKKIE